jgi:4-diphosphocytidyl-2-C-methyl-D-erythritol kinase
MNDRSARAATSATAVRVVANAKLNLRLRILAREANGYHTLESLFIKLALADHVTVRTDVAERSLVCTGPAMPPAGLGAPEQNLAWRAAEQFAQAAGWPTAFAITIEKHIPVGGGLGGGSADAAAVLRGLNTIAPNPLPLENLLAIAAGLGADVPFLVSDALLAWTWGRGDRLLALPPLPVQTVRLVTFAEGVNTAAAYAALAAQRASAATAGQNPHNEAPERRFYSLADFSNWSAVSNLAHNDFESVVPALHRGVARCLPAVQRVARDLADLGFDAMGMMSGSGATCFVLSPENAPLTWPGELAGERVMQTRTAAAIVAPEPIA